MGYRPVVGLNQKYPDSKAPMSMRSKLGRLYPPPAGFGMYFTQDFMLSEPLLVSGEVMPGMYGIPRAHTKPGLSPLNPTIWLLGTTIPRDIQLFWAKKPPHPIPQLTDAGKDIVRQHDAAIHMVVENKCGVKGLADNRVVEKIQFPRTAAGITPPNGSSGDCAAFPPER